MKFLVHIWFCCKDCTSSLDMLDFWVALFTLRLLNIEWLFIWFAIGFLIWDESNLFPTIEFIAYYNVNVLIVMSPGRVFSAERKIDGLGATLSIVLPAVIPAPPLLSRLMYISVVISSFGLDASWKKPLSLLWPCLLPPEREGLRGLSARSIKSKLDCFCTRACRG